MERAYARRDVALLRHNDVHFVYEKHSALSASCECLIDNFKLHFKELESLMRWKRDTMRPQANGSSTYNWFPIAVFVQGSLRAQFNGHYRVLLMVEEPKQPASCSSNKTDHGHQISISQEFAQQLIVCNALRCLSLPLGRGRCWTIWSSDDKWLEADSFQIINDASLGAKLMNWMSRIL